MNSILVSLVLVVLAQGWEQPEMEASELDAPASMTQTTPEPSESSSEDLDSSAAQSAAPSQTTRWEYDESGKPVARVDAEETPASTPKAAEKKPENSSEKAAEEKKQAKPKAKSSGRVATFWFILPRK